METSSDLTGDWTHDLLACSIMPRPTMLFCALRQEGLRKEMTPLQTGPRRAMIRLLISVVIAVATPTKQLSLYRPSHLFATLFLPASNVDVWGLGKDTLLWEHIWCSCICTSRYLTGFESVDYHVTLLKSHSATALFGLCNWFLWNTVSYLFLIAGREFCRLKCPMEPWCFPGENMVWEGILCYQVNSSQCLGETRRLHFRGTREMLACMYQTAWDDILRSQENINLEAIVCTDRHTYV
jgi:hypothetical protein